MIYSWKNRYDVIIEMQQFYPDLQISEEREESVKLRGNICVNRKISDFTL